MGNKATSSSPPFGGNNHHNNTNTKPHSNDSDNVSDFSTDSDFDDDKGNIHDNRHSNSIVDSVVSQQLLLGHNNINIAQIENVLKLIERDEGKTQLLPFIIDSYHLMQYNCTMNESHIYTPRQFFRKYAFRTHKNFANGPLTAQFLTKLFEECMCMFILQ